MKRGTAWQAEVLAILREHARPMSAYDLLDELKADTAKIAPPSVYRALASLVAQGHVHRLESLNAYIACRCDTHNRASVMSICTDCGEVEENVAPELMSDLSTLLEDKGFAAERHVIEVHGTCASCGTEPAA